MRRMPTKGDQSAISDAPREADPLDSVARYLSVLGHPFLVMPASVGTIVVLRGGELRIAIAIAVLFAAASVVVLLGIRAGWFNDFDVSERERRPGLYLLLISGSVALAVWHRDDAQALYAWSIAGAALVACAVINRWSKASLHTAFSLYAAGLWGTWSLGAGLVAAPIAAAVAWSRVHLGRHSSREVFTGGVVGVLAAGALVLLAR